MAGRQGTWPIPAFPPDTGLGQRFIPVAQMRFGEAK